MDVTEAEDTVSVPSGNKEEDLEQEMQKLMQEAKEELKKAEEGLERDADIAEKLAKLKTTGWSVYCQKVLSRAS